MLHFVMLIGGALYALLGLIMKEWPLLLASFLLNLIVLAVLTYDMESASEGDEDPDAVADRG